MKSIGGRSRQTKLLAGWFVENEVASSHAVRFLGANGLEAGKIGDIKVSGMIKTAVVARKRAADMKTRIKTLFFHLQPRPSLIVAVTTSLRF